MQACPAPPRTDQTACPVQPLDRVLFTPHDESGLSDLVSGTVFQALDTSGGNWRIRVVLLGEPFPNGRTCNVYSHEGSFQVLGTLNPDDLPATA